MKFAHIPKGQYKIGQELVVLGERMVVESYTHTGRNVVVHSLPNAPKFQRIVCLCADSNPIEEVRS